MTTRLCSKKWRKGERKVRLGKFQALQVRGLETLAIRRQESKSSLKFASVANMQITKPAKLDWFRRFQRNFPPRRAANSETG